MSLLPATHHLGPPFHYLSSSFLWAMEKQEYDWDKWIGVDRRKGKIIISEHRLGVSLFWQVCSSRDLNL